METDFSTRIARELLEIGAVSFSPQQPFTWASGLKSPVYCDNRQILGYPEVRRMVIDGFVSTLSGLAESPAAIVGTATAGIPHAAWLADRLNLPMAYVRSKPKAHGKKNQTEGWMPDKASVVVVEDLVSTGMSSKAVVEVLLDQGYDVLAVVAIFSYGFEEAVAVFNALDIPLKTLTGFEDLIQVAVEEQRIPSDAIESLRAWRRDPVTWSES